MRIFSPSPLPFVHCDDAELSPGRPLNPLVAHDSTRLAYVSLAGVWIFERLFHVFSIFVDHLRVSPIWEEVLVVLPNKKHSNGSFCLRFNDLGDHISQWTY